jgi:hypothetical protein
MAEDMDLDPSGFVQRIRQLGEQHDQHDQHEAERVKKLEEELIQGRSERLARRAGGFSCSAPSAYSVLFLFLFSFLFLSLLPFCLLSPPRFLFSYSFSPLLSSLRRASPSPPWPD